MPSVHKLFALVVLALLPLSVALGGICDDDFCYMSFHDGLAGAQLGQIVDGDAQWGYIDNSGDVVIKPGYEDVESFHNGLAAVELDDAWGYINKQGQWVIQPAFETATAFNAAGSALVNQHGRVHLIDHDGNILKTFAPGTRIPDEGFVTGTGLALLRTPGKPRIWRSSDGTAYDLPDDVVKAAPPQGQWIAVRRYDAAAHIGGWGFLDAATMEWAVAPDVLDANSYAPPRTDGTLIAVSRDDQHVLVDLKGNRVVDGARSIELVMPGFWWVVQKQTYEINIYDDQGKLLYGPLSRRADYRRVASDWLAAVITTPNKLILMRRDGTRQTFEAAEASIEQYGHYWFVTREGDDYETVLLQVYDDEGKALFDEGKLQQLAGYSVSMLTGNATTPASQTVFLAELTPRKDDQNGAALLTSSGEIVTNAKLVDVDTKQSMRSVAIAASEYRGPYGVIDMDGDWIIPPDKAYAVVLPAGDYYLYGQGSRFDMSFTVQSASGESVSVPPRVLKNFADVGRHVLVFEQRTSEGEYYGLWSLSQQKVVSKAEFDQINEFWDGYALARKNGNWGVLDTAGHWQRVPGLSDSYGTKRHGDVYVFETDSGYGIYNYVTSDLIAGDLRDEPEVLSPDRFLIRPADGGLQLVDAEGKVLVQSRLGADDIEVKWDGLVLRSDEHYGAINARGEWQVEPVYNYDFSFVEPTMLAQVSFDGQAVLINVQGKQLSKLKGKPVRGMQRLVFGTTVDYDDFSVMTDLESHEITRLPGEYAFRTEDAGDGVLPFQRRLDDGYKYGFVNADGKQIIGAYFDELGRMVNNRAPAVMEARYGDAYGYIDRSGYFVIPPRYDWVLPFSEGRALVARNGIHSYIDHQGNVVAQLLTYCGSIVVVDADNQPIWPQEVEKCTQ